MTAFKVVVEFCLVVVFFNAFSCKRSKNYKKKTINSGFLCHHLYFEFALCKLNIFIKLLYAAKDSQLFEVYFCFLIYCTCM